MTAMVSQGNRLIEVMTAVMTEASETKKEAQGEGSETGEARLATTYDKVSVSPTQSKEREREKT